MARLQELPNELLTHILSFIGGDIVLLSSIALLSRRLANVAREPIFRSVRFVLVNTPHQIEQREKAVRRIDPRCRGKQSFELFRDVVKSNPMCAGLVRKFVVDVEARWRANPPWGRDYTPEIYDVIASLHCLEALEVSLPSGNAGLGSYIPVSHPSLRKLTVTKSHILIDQLVDHLLEPNFIESLSVSVAGFQESEFKKEVLLEDGKNTRALKRIDIYYMGRNVSAIRALIAVSNSLESLRLTLKPEQGNCSPETLFPAVEDARWLRHAKLTLKELTIVGGRRRSPLPILPVDLSKFVALRKVTLPEFALIDLRVPIAARQGAYRRLPRALEDLEITSSFDEADLFHPTQDQVRRGTVVSEEANVDWLLEFPLNKPSYFYSLSQIVWSEILWRDPEKIVHWLYPAALENTFAASDVQLIIQQLSNVSGAKIMYHWPSDRFDGHAFEVTQTSSTDGFSLESLQQDHSTLASLQQENSYTSHSTRTS